MIRKKPSSVNDPSMIKRLSKTAYRNSYLDSQVRTWIAYQIKALRKKSDFTQAEMAKCLDKPQSVISRLENADYGRLSVNTLLDIAKSMNVALLVQFVSYPDFLERTRDKSEQAMQPDTFDESVAILEKEKKIEYNFPQINSRFNAKESRASARSVQEKCYRQIPRTLEYLV